MSGEPLFLLSVSGHHWLGEEPESDSDLCSHGLVTLVIGGVGVLDGEDLCTSAATLRLLRTLTEDSLAKPCTACEQMIPCCGHMLTYDKRGRVLPDGCPNGATFSVEHLQTPEGRAVRIGAVEAHLGAERPLALGPVVIPFETYSAQVRAFAAAVKAFYGRSNPRQLSPDEVVTDCENAYADMWKEIDERLSSPA